MIQRILITMALFMLFGMPAAYGQDSPEEVQERVTQAMSTESNVNEQAYDWNWEKQNIIQDIRDAKYKVTWLEYRQEKTQQYIATAKEDIAILEDTKAELFNLRDQLEPYLETIILRLEEFIAQDLPFLPSEREKRIDQLKASMNRPEEEVHLSEKMRRVFEEGLQIETQYGQMAPAEDEVLNIDGVDTQVVVFRMGRVGMYYMSLDEEQIGYYTKNTGQWEPLPESMIRDISLAVDMGEQKRTIEIVNLPLGAVE